MKVGRSIISSRKKIFRQAGDAARDRKDWVAAAGAYRQHLATTPDDFNIWIQYGHSLKEQDDLMGAEEAYRNGLELKPDDEDAQKQLGHLLKQMGKAGEAVEIFTSLLRKSGSREAYVELTSLGSGGELNDDLVIETKIAPADAVYIEIDDMLGYLEAHKTLSGIQRVQVGVIQHVLSTSNGLTTERYLFVLNPMDSKCLWKIESLDLRKLIDYVTSSQVDHGRLKQLVANARRNATVIMPQAGQTYLVLGAFWGYGGVAGRYFHLKRAGVVIGVYIYDLIPITHTEYCDEGLPHEFTLSLGDGLSVFDFILAISEYTAGEVRRYIQKLSLPMKPIQAVPLAHSNSIASRQHRDVWGPKIAFLRNRPFVMMVSTIEARKNHAYLVAIWKHFLDEGLEPPDLVFVGRFGWRVTSLMEMLQTTRYFDGRIHVLHDLSDAELDTLYRACKFTAFPSFVEGWGLPVGESLAHGKPCVASSTSSVPEVGGDLVDYIDPLNLRNGIDVIRRMAFDEKYLASREAAVKSTFHVRTWQDVGADLLLQVDRLRRQVSPNRHPETFFPSGSSFRPGDLALGNRLPKNYAVSPTRLMLTNSWYGVETLGCWMRGSEGTLIFTSDLPKGTAIIVYLRLYGAPPQLCQGLALAVAVASDIDERPRWSATKFKSVEPSVHFLRRAQGIVGQSGLVIIHLSLTGHVNPEDSNDSNSRRFGIGLAYVGYTATNDVAKRMELMDELMFDGM